jgi:hypothetical protein
MVKNITLGEETILISKILHNSAVLALYHYYKQYILPVNMSYSNFSINNF